MELLHNEIRLIQIFCPQQVFATQPLAYQFRKQDVCATVYNCPLPKLVLAKVLPRYQWLYRGWGAITVPISSQAT